MKLLLYNKYLKNGFVLMSQ